AVNKSHYWRRPQWTSSLPYRRLRVVRTRSMEAASEPDPEPGLALGVLPTAVRNQRRDDELRLWFTGTYQWNGAADEPTLPSRPQQLLAQTWLCLEPIQGRRRFCSSRRIRDRL